MSTTVVLERLPVDKTGSSDKRWHLLKRQRVYILPTRQGGVYGLMLIVMLLGAINYNNSMAFMLCFLLAGLALVGMLHTYKNLCSLLISAKQAMPVFAGDVAQFPIQFDNRYGSQRFSIQLATKPRQKITQTQDNTTLSISLDANKQTVVNYPLQAHRRGILHLQRLKISSCFPLGLFQAWAYFEPKITCLIYPYPKGQTQLPKTIAVDGHAGSMAQTGTDDFMGFRRYQVGDPICWVAWKKSAKEQGLLTKQFQGNGAHKIVLSWQSVANISDVETKLSQLCYWITLADKTQMHYGLEMPERLIKPSCGTQHQAACLATLAYYGKKHEDD